MKLYFSPGACAMASQIILREAGYKFDLVKVDLKSKRSAEGDYLQVNPKGYVPALKLDDGSVLTEGAVILQYLADNAPDKKLLPKFGTMERYRAMEWLNFVSTELHKGLGVFFNPKIQGDVRQSLVDKLNLRLAFLDNHLKMNAYVLGSEFSVIDAYIFNIIRWSGPLKIDLTPYAGILGLMEKVGARGTARAAIEAEGLKG